MAFADHQEQLAYQRRYYQEHREEILARSRGEVRRDYQRRWYQEHRLTILAKEKLLREENPEKYRLRSRCSYTKRAGAACLQKKAKRYGVSPEAFSAMMVRQEGLCAICRRKPGKRGLGVDHEHGTGRLRSLLCGPCNLGLGIFHDDPERLLAAARYLTIPMTPSSGWAIQ